MKALVKRAEAPIEKVVLELTPHEAQRLVNVAYDFRGNQHILGEVYAILTIHGLYHNNNF